MDDQYYILMVGELSRLEPIKELLDESDLSAASIIVTDELAYDESLDDLPDMIICDIESENFGGMAALQMRNQMYNPPPFVFFVSKDEHEQNALQGLEEGATDYYLIRDIPRLVRALHRIILAFRNTQRLEALDILYRKLTVSYNELLESSPFGTFRITSDNSFVEASPSMAKMLGFATTSELLDNEKLNILWKWDEEDEEDDNQVQVYRAETKDGKEIWLEVNIHPVKNPTEEVLYYEGFVRDISEQKIAEQSLRFHEQRYRAAFNTMKQGYILSDANGTIIEVNPFMADVLHYPPEKLQGENIISILHPEDREIFAEYYGTLTEEKRSHIRCRMIQRKEGDFTVDVEGTILQLGNDDLYMLAVQDVAGQNEAACAEAWLLQSLSAIPMLVLILDPEGYIRWANQSIYDMLGYEEQELIEMHPTDLLVSEDEEDEDGVNEILKKAMKDWYDNVKLLGKEGEIFNVSLLIKRIRGVMNENLGFVLLGEDMENKRSGGADCSEEIANKMRYSSDQLIASSLAQSIRLPMYFLLKQHEKEKRNIENTLNHYPCDTEMLYDRLEKTAERIFILHEGLRRNCKIVEQIHTGSQNGDDSDEVQEFDLNEIIRVNLTMVKEEVEKTFGITIHQHLANEILLVKAKHFDIDLILNNLLSNAIDAVREAKKKIITVRTGKSRDNVWFEIKDTGIGISEENLENVGKTFFTTKQKDPVAKQLGGGVGLGIFTIRRVLNELDGHMEMITKPGDTRFTIVLPAVEPQENGENHQ